MNENERNFYLFGVLAASEYVRDKITAKAILRKFNLTPVKIRKLERWMDERLEATVSRRVQP